MDARTLLALQLCLAGLAIGAPAAAQDETALKAAFEGKRVTLRIDMPGSSEGVDVHHKGDSTIDYPHYRNDLKRYGTAIRAGDAVTVTLVKVKKDLIEFHLAGGGFGTFSDDTSTSAPEARMTRTASPQSHEAE